MRLIELHRSRAVAAVGYDDVAGTLRVLFRNGGLYDYFDVPPEIHAGLLDDDHPWSRYGLEIKQHHRCRRIE